MAQSQTLQGILNQEQTKAVLKKLGVEHMPQEKKAELLSKIGLTVMNRLTLEILTALPPSERDAFSAFYDSGDYEGFRACIDKHIPNFDAFVFKVAQKEIAEIEERARVSLK